MTINKSMLSHTNKVQAEEIAALRAEVERLKQNPEGYWRGQWAQEAQLRVAAESEATRLKAERDEAMAAGYAQGVEATEARASKRIAALEADYERVQKLSSDAGSKGHKLLAELTRLREREKVLVEALLLSYKGVQALWEKDGVTLNGIPSLSEFHDLMDRATDWGRHPPDFAALSAEPEGKEKS